MARGYFTTDLIEDAKVVVLADATASVASSGNAIFGPKLAQYFWVGTAGDVNLMLSGGGLVLFKSATAGVWHKAPPFKNVQDTDTAAVDVVVATVY